MIENEKQMMTTIGKRRVHHWDRFVLAEVGIFIKRATATVTPMKVPTYKGIRLACC